MSRLSGIPIPRLRKKPKRVSLPAWAPTDVTGLDLWLKADAEVYEDAGITLSSDSDPVEQWVDQSPNGKILEQTTASKQPTFIASGINSIPTVQFDGTDDFLQLSENYLTSIQGTIAIVFQIATTPSDNQTVIASSDEAGSTKTNAFFGLAGASGRDIRHDFGDGAGGGSNIRGETTIADETPYIIVFDSDGSTYRQFQDNSELTLGIDSGANDGDWFGDIAGLDNVTIGAKKQNTENGFFKGFISEIIVYNSILNASDFNLLHTYLSQRYNISV